MKTLFFGVCPGGVPSWILWLKFALLLMYLFWEQYLIQENAGFKSFKKILHYLLNRPVEYNYILLIAFLLLYNLILNLGGIGFMCKDFLGSSPYFISFEPVISFRTIIPLLIFFITIKPLVKWSRDDNISKRKFLAFCILIFLLQSISTGWIKSADFSNTFQQFFNNKLEYMGAVVNIDKIPEMMKNYVNSMDSLPFHVRAHPPGSILFLSVLNFVCSGSQISIAFIVTIIGCLGIFLCYKLSRHIFESERSARYSALFYLYCPSLLLYNFLSMNLIFSLLIVYSIYLFHRSLNAFSIKLSGYTGFIIALSCFFSFTSSYIFIYCSLFLILSMIFFKKLPDKTIQSCLIFAVPFLLFYIILYYFSGFNIIGCFMEALEFNTLRMGSAWRSLQHYIFIITGNLAGLFTFCGIPISIIFFKLYLDKKYSTNNRIFVFSLNLLLSILILNFAGLYQWEVERIWTFLVMPIIITAGYYYHTASENPEKPFSIFKGNEFSLIFIIFILFMQSILTEIIFNTHW